MFRTLSIALSTASFSRLLSRGALLGVLLGAPAMARAPLDGVAATVDGTPILFSEIEELRGAMLQQRPGFSSLPVSAQRNEALNRMVDDKVLLAKAKQDTTLRVSDKDVDARVADMYARVAQQQGGERQLEIALRQATGMSLGQFKMRMSEQVRENMYRQRVQMKYVGDPQPSQLQVREFFEKYRDSLPVQYDVVRLSHLQWRVKAGEALEKEARARGEALIARLDKGESFAELAKLHSDDFSGKEGGDLGYTKRGTLDPDYERAAFSLDAGDYTRRPVRTRYGFHIIRATGTRDNEVRTSHILIRVTPSAADSVRARTFLDSLSRTLTTADAFKAAARSLSEDRKTRDLGGDLGWFSRDSLAGSYKAVVDSLPEGGVSRSVTIGENYHLFRVDRKVAERRLSLEEDFVLISQYAREWLVGQKLAALIKSWRETTHVGNNLAKFSRPGEDDAAPDSEDLPD
jgi:peptidyl-prolyl cis-trans isomerase SurA